MTAGFGPDTRTLPQIRIAAPSGDPGEVTRVRMRFDPAEVPFTVPLASRTGVAGHEFVWHCHILAR